MIWTILWALIKASPWLLLAGAVLLAALAATGFTSIARIINAVLSIFAGIVEFFKTQTAAKILFGAICLFVGAFIGDWHGTSTERAIWVEKQAAMQKRIDALNQDNADLRKLAKAQERDRKPVFEQQVTAYEKSISTAEADRCGFTDADLRELRKYRRAPVQRGPK